MCVIYIVMSESLKVIEKVIYEINCWKYEEQTEVPFMFISILTEKVMPLDLGAI